MRQSLLAQNWYFTLTFMGQRKKSTVNALSHYGTRRRVSRNPILKIPMGYRSIWQAPQESLALSIRKRLSRSLNYCGKTQKKQAGELKEAAGEDEKLLGEADVKMKEAYKKVELRPFTKGEHENIRECVLPFVTGIFQKMG